MAAQAAPPLERLISVSIRQQRLDEALKTISRAGSFSFAYNPAILDNNGPVSLQHANSSVREVLNDLFKGKITYKSRGNHIILHRAELPRDVPKNFILEGYIVDSRTGKKIDQVSIYELNTLASTVTNPYGYYRIKLPTDLSAVRLEIRRKYYFPQTVRVSARQSHSLNIQMTPAPIQEARPRLVIRTSVDTTRPTPATPQPIVTAVPVTVDTTKPGPNPVLANLGRHKSEFLDWVRTTRQTIHDANLSDDTLYRRVQIAVLPFLGSNHTLSGRVINDVSVNVIAGYSLGIRRLELGGGFNLVRGDVDGIQIAGVGNLVGEQTTGVQGAGVLNVNRRDFFGLQLAGFGNNVGGTFQGLQAAGFYNLTVGSMVQSVQAAGLVNMIGHDMKGIQGAGYFNLVGRDLQGFQLAGFGNVVAGDASGGQLAGFFNITAKQLNGWQLAGFLNYATRVSGGHQISLVNVAEYSETTPFGLFSYVSRNGYRRLEVSTDEVNALNLTFKTGVRSFYNIFTVGTTSSQPDLTGWSLGYGFGSAIDLKRGWGLNFDLTGNWALHEGWQYFDEGGGLLRLSTAIERKLGNRLAIAVGPSVNWYLGNIDYPAPSTRVDVPLFSHQRGAANLYSSGWVGFQAALRFCNK